MQICPKFLRIRALPTLLWCMKSNCGKEWIQVEEELKNQRELMREQFALSEKRFGQIQASTDKHFEQVDKRFEDINTRLGMIFSFMSLGFTILAGMMTVFRFV